MQEKGLALMARKLRSALMAEGEFVDEGLSAFADDGDITRELTRCLLSGHRVPGLEETFRALKEVEKQSSHGSEYIGTPPEDAEKSSLNMSGASEDNLQPQIALPSTEVVIPAGEMDRTTHTTNGSTSLSPPDPEQSQRAWQHLEELRTRKKELEAKRTVKRVSITRTLSGNPGQLSLFRS